MKLLAAPPEEVRPVRRRRFPLVGVILLTALTVTMAGIFPFRQMIAQQRQVDQTQARLDVLVEGNGRLEAEIVALESPAEVERLAREQYGLVRPGETAYKIDQPEDSVIASEPESFADPLDERTLLERAWDFLTGRDLVPDE